MHNLNDRAIVPLKKCGLSTFMLVSAFCVCVCVCV